MLACFNEAAAESPRKSTHPGQERGQQVRFNEAAAESPRKLPICRKHGTPNGSFNEAAAESPRKCTPKEPHLMRRAMLQ